MLRPSLLTVYQVAPEKLELSTLWDNMRVLGHGAQKTTRFEIAFWNKIFYPAAVIVMMIVALPFSYFQRRQGGVGFRIFAGTMLGLTFFLVGRLFSNLGVLNDWPPLFSPRSFRWRVLRQHDRWRCSGGSSGGSAFLRRRGETTGEKNPGGGAGISSVAERTPRGRSSTPAGAALQLATGTTFAIFFLSLPLVANATVPSTSANSVWSLPMPDVRRRDGSSCRAGER